MGAVIFWSAVGLIAGLAALVLLEEVVFGSADQRPRSAAWLAFCGIVILIARDFLGPFWSHLS